MSKLSFSAERPSVLSYTARFDSKDYANISFFDRETDAILFHLSLRADEGRAVCNKRGAEEDSWGREIARKAKLPAEGGVAVEIAFTPPRIVVRLDGVQLFNFGPGLMGNKFPGIDRVGRFDFNGGIAESTLDIDTRIEEEAAEGLMLNQRLELRDRRALSNAALPLHVAIAGQDTRLPVITTPRPGAPGTYDLRAAVPGRVWKHVPEKDSLVLSLISASEPEPLASLSLNRADLVTRAAQSIHAAGLETDALAAGQIMEHVRYANILDALPAPALAKLAEAAAFYGLERFVWPDNHSHAGAPDTAAARPQTPVKAPVTDPVAEAVARIGAHLRADPKHDAAAALATFTPAMTGTSGQNIYVMLAGTFCQLDRFEVLFDHANEHGFSAFSPADESWFNSAVLPFLLMQGDMDALRNAFWSLTEDLESWLTTPTIAWVMRHALSLPELEETLRDDLIYAFMELITQRTQDYWQHTPCTELINAAVALLRTRSRLPDYAQEDVDWFLLRAYGLSRVFWNRIRADRDATGIPLPPLLTTAETAYDIIRDAAEGNSAPDPEILHRALALFDQAKTADAVRLRHDLLGPARLPLGPGGEAPNYSALIDAGLDAGQAGLRYMAFPGAQPVEPALAESTTAAMAAAYPEVPRAPYYKLQKSVSQRAIALLNSLDPPGTEPDCAQIDALADDLAVLSSPRSFFVGLGTGLSLVAGLIDAGAPPDAAARLLDRIGGMLRMMPEPEQAQAQQATVVRTALSRLYGMAEAGEELAASACTLFGVPAGALPHLPPNGLDGIGAPSALFDTVVCILSCKPNLETRVPALRDSWLRDLEAMGIPYVIIVGGEDGPPRLDEDVLWLDAPDDYEGLPQKTLSTIAWVRDHTCFAHMLKVDDDCFLNAEEFFHSLSYRKFDYYGRTLTRVRGQMDRAWHMGKSSSLRGRMELDKSPEPSTYTDGGTGYCLSRQAMETIEQSLSRPDGRVIEQHSFMEDKLIGDLLALGGITPNSEDYRITMRRRSFGDAIPVAAWVNGFNPSQVAPVKLAHLDTHLEQQAVHQGLSETAFLYPKKIWPSFQPPQLGYNSNALEMVTSADRLDAAQSAQVAVVACMRNEMFMLPRFLEHYRNLGVGSFLIADNGSDDGTLEYLAQQPDVALFSVDTDYSQSRYGVAWQQALMAAFRTGRWCLVADADELLVWQNPQVQTLPQLLAEPEFATAEAARIFMLDMYPKGPLEAADFVSDSPFVQAGYVDRDPFRADTMFRGPFSNQLTWTSALRHRLLPGSKPDLFVAQKLALLKYSPFMRLSAGLHYAADLRVAPRELIFAHFKYNADFRRKAQAEVARGQHFNDAEEYRKYLALVSEGRDVIHDPDLSVPWTEAAFVRQRLNQG